MKWHDLRPTEYLSYSIGILILVLMSILIYKRRKYKMEKLAMKNQQLNELVVESSIYRQIVLLKKNLGEGRYGKVIKGLYNDREVAIKIFKSNDYESFKRELNIYKIRSLSRESILNFIGSDTVNQLTNFGTEYWLVLDFCELGSLYDYLQANILKKDQLMLIMLSAISGLAHLHDNQEFTVSKPAIAHRDFKSKNLLMKSNRAVCIADFGLSLTSNDISNEKPMAIKVQQGTKRYLSPEILTDQLDKSQIESFISSDIYCFSLVFWETLNQSKFNPNAGTFLLPYHEYTDNDPSIEKMKNVVAVNNYRPKLLSDGSSILDSIRSIIEVCWQSNPNHRPNAYQIKEKLENLYLEFVDNGKN